VTILLEKSIELLY